MAPGKVTLTAEDASLEWDESKARHVSYFREKGPSLPIKGWQLAAMHAWAHGNSRIPSRLPELLEACRLVGFSDMARQVQSWIDANTLFRELPSGPEPSPEPTLQPSTPQSTPEPSPEPTSQPSPEPSTPQSTSQPSPEQTSQSTSQSSPEPSPEPSTPQPSPEPIPKPSPKASPQPKGPQRQSFPTPSPPRDCWIDKEMQRVRKRRSRHRALSSNQYPAMCPSPYTFLEDLSHDFHCWDV